MKTLTSSALSLVFAGMVYTQAYHVSMDMLKKMEGVLDNASAQLMVDPSAANTPPSLY